MRCFLLVILIIHYRLSLVAIVYLTLLDFDQLYFLSVQKDVAVDMLLLNLCLQIQIVIGQGEIPHLKDLCRYFLDVLLVGNCAFRSLVACAWLSA